MFIVEPRSQVFCAREYGTFIYMKKKNTRTKAKSTKTTSKSLKKSQPKRVVSRKIVKKIPTKIKSKPKAVKVVKIKAPMIPKEGIVQGKMPTDMNLLEQFFGGPFKLKLWKVFALNASKEFTLKDLTRLTKTKSTLLIQSLKEMMRQGIIEGHKKAYITEKQQKDRAIFYRLTKEYPLMPEITQLILTAIPRSSDKVLSELQPLMRLKTVLLSGFFTSKLGLSTQTFSATQSPVDMLLVFEKIPVNVTDIVSELEHKLGRDLRYAALDETDFKYRHSIGDKLIRDVLDFDHIVAMDKMAFFR